MARPYMFLVHGVGKHPAGWDSSWKAALIGELQRYAPYEEMTAEEIESDVIAFVPIGYDEIFEGFRERWGDLASALAETNLVPDRALQKGLRWVADHGEADGFEQVFWEKVLDALLWTFNPIARARVMASVSQQLVDGLIAMAGENGEPNSHIVAHSLGTSVTHDSTIALMAARDVHEGALAPKFFKWTSLFMVANTSRLLEPWVDLSDDLDVDDFNVYRSAIQPGLRGSVCRSYFNARHRIDPITWPRCFGPRDWQDDAFLDIELTRFDELQNVHNFEHYVADPAVHLRLFRKVLGNKRLGTREEVRRAIEGYERDYPLQASIELDNLRSLLGGDFEKRLGPAKLAEYLTRVFEEVRA